MKARIIIADDHQLLIDGLQSVLAANKEWELIEPVNDGRALLDRLANTEVDLVLLDLNMPQLDGIKSLEQIKRLYPRIKVLVISNYHQAQLILNIQQMGADGYLLKNTNASTLLKVIELILNGEKFFDAPQSQGQEIPDYFIDDFLKKYQLTKREVEIIKMIGDEMTSREIGQQLYISEFTVNTHRKNIMRKLAVKNLAGIMNFAKSHGIC
ncbi:DNA-binding response regulator [Chitinophaga caeni]|uniref:DNA-binding response regulator n=1 Tax=Chitinophaga caeni TaxID=2029983 RepID=A0A291QS24_9BACT|nr:response regulator transcription factor [Chitinophaga caeni]ATL46693.1 DNA-binding response regulator [Chitinophaga caeni]